MEEAPLNVLLVDDQPNTLFVMREALCKTGGRFIEATSGKDALRQTLLYEFALILLDIHMPEMDGYETARLLRSVDRTRHTPILFITGTDGGDVAAMKGYAAGGVDFLRKPVSTDLLVAKVTAYLELFQRLREEKKNILLKQELEKRQSDANRLRELAFFLQEAREEERKRIAHEVHDELGSRLAKIKMDLMHELRTSEPLRDLAWPGRILSQVEGVIESVRRVALSLRPPILDEMGLFSSLEWLAQDFSMPGTIQVTISHDSQNVATHDTLKTALFRIAQESLTNALRHGQATRVELTLKRGKERIHLSIADDGKGLSGKAHQVIHGMGFRGMEERLRPFGGVLKLERSVMGGLLLVAIVPEIQRS